MSTQLCCPWCNAQGMNHIGLYPTNKQVVITYCRDCMAIRGVMPLIGSSPPGPEDRLLRCPWCNAFKKEQIKIAPVGKGWVIVFCQSCGAIHGLTPIIEPKSAALPKQEDALPKQDARPKEEPLPAISTVSPSNPFGNMQLLIEIGNADLEAKKAQYEAELNRRVMMAKGGGTLYRAVALDDGPPYCLACQRDMEPQLVPPGYKNSGQKIWLCPNQCGAWEAG